MNISGALRGRTFQFALCLVALGIVLSAALSLLDFEMTGYDNEVSIMIFTVIYTMMAAGALMLRHGFYEYAVKRSDAEHKLTPFHQWSFIWFLPLMATVVLLPWIFAGVFNSDDGVGVAGIFLLLSAIFYIMFFLGFLVLPFIILPLELIGRGMIKVLRTGGKQGVPMLSVGGYIALVTAFIFVGGFSIETDMPGRFSWPLIIYALFGLPSDGYQIVDSSLIWAARILGIIILAIPLGAWRISKMTTPISE